MPGLSAAHDLTLLTAAHDSSRHGFRTTLSGNPLSRPDPLASLRTRRILYVVEADLGTEQVELIMTRLGMGVAQFASVQLTVGQEQSFELVGTVPSFPPMTWERLVNAAEEPHNWLMYAGTFDNQRCSGLHQIHTRNESELDPQVGVSAVSARSR